MGNTDTDTGNQRNKNHAYLEKKIKYKRYFDTY